MPFSIDNKLTSNKQLTTFRVPVKAHAITIARWPREVYSAYQRALNQNKGFIILGQGSNVLFVEDFEGEVVLNQYQGIKVESDSEYYYLHVNSGVSIDHLIAYCHRFKIYGLENLSLIPSSVGTAVISNIGAYGVEFAQFVEYVDLLNLNTGETFRLSKQDCEFGYRQSIFKSKYSKGYVVTTVGLKIPKKYTPVLTYSPLNQLDPESVSAKEVQQLVVKTRTEKLPNFDKVGNAGSFFCNPIVTMDVFHEISAKFPHVVSYEVDYNHVKLSAGWLIEQCNLKGYKYGKAQVYPHHALVLTNPDLEASGQEIAKLAAFVQHKVYKVFKVLLTPEVRLIGRHGEVEGTSYLQKLYHDDPIEA